MKKKHLQSSVWENSATLWRRHWQNPDMRFWQWTGTMRRCRRLPLCLLPPVCRCNGAGVMESLDFSNVDVAVIGISDHMEASIIATLYAKEAGVSYVLVKANGVLHGHILKKIGADEVIFPEYNTGVRVAKNFISGRFKDFFELSDEVSMVEMHVPDTWVAKA